MPQMDSATFLSQVFWLILIFGTFYLIVQKNILPVLSRIIKVRTKKLYQGQNLLIQMQDETNTVTEQYERILSANLKTSGQMLQKISDTSNLWVEKEALRKTGKETLDSTTVSMNENYLKTAASLTGKKNLILPILKGL